MTGPFWCLFAATLWLVLSKVPMNILGARLEPYDNHYPRLQQQRLRGAAHRAWAAHHNMQEAYPAFAAAVLVSHLGRGDPLLATLLGGLFLAARLSYQLCYLLDWPQARSISWGIGLLATLVLMLTPLRPVG
ncbi:MAG TPA: MAPEG family protein [Motiliproteus sp.]